MLARQMAATILLLNIAATEPQTRLPTSRWEMQFADFDCLLSRHYGTGEKDRLILTLKQLPMETGIDVYVMRTGKNLEMSGGSASVDFGEGRSITTKYAAYRLGSDTRTVNIFVEGDAYKAASRSGVIQIDVKNEINTRFAVPGIGPALKLLDQCAANLGELWGITKDQQKRMATPAKPSKPWNEILRSSDYPKAAQRADASGKAIARYTIDELGRLSDCILLKPSGNREIDSATCKLLKRATFEPARDHRGKPMRTVMVTSVSWLLMN